MTSTERTASGLLGPDTVLRRHVEDLSARFAGMVDPQTVERLVVESMAATDGFPEPLTDDVVQAADVVITMGCGDACPIHPGKRYLDRDVADPAGQDRAAEDAIATDIETRVRGLLAELGA